MKSIYRREFDLDGFKAYKIARAHMFATIVTLFMIVALVAFDYDYNGLMALKYFIRQEGKVVFNNEEILETDGTESISELLARYKEWQADRTVASFSLSSDNDYEMSGYELYNTLMPDNVNSLNIYLRSFIKSFASMDMIICAKSDKETIEGYIELRRHEPGLVRTWQGFLYSHMEEIQGTCVMLFTYSLLMSITASAYALKHSRNIN